MKLPFTLEHGVYGPRASLTGPWVPAVSEYMRRENIRELYLNYARGWKGEDLSFLETLPDLLGFSIIDFGISDIARVHTLTALRALEISTYCSTPIDFARFPDLERTVFYWRSGSDSLFDLIKLRSLFVHRYVGSVSEPFGRLTTLTELSIANSDLLEIESVRQLSHLRFLGLYNLKKLKSLRGLQALFHLEALDVNGCKKLESINELKPLTKLRRLHLNDDGKVDSLRPLQGLTELEELLFYESTNVVDGDLAVIKELPRLKKISFQNRRHYSHRREDFQFSDA